MDIKIVEEKESPLLKRKDLHLEISHESAPTPSKAELTKQLAEKYKVDESQVVIGYMFTAKGMCKTAAKVKILKEKPKAPKAAEKKEAPEAAREKPEGKAEERAEKKTSKEESG